MGVQLTDLSVSDFKDFDNHERVVLIEDESCGLKALVSIHNSNLGPAMGGCRYYPYATQEDGIKDVLRLSRGMTYKSALAGLPLGGGKSVIFGNPRTDKSDDILQAFGEGLEKLDGAYITAEDVGTTEQDMETISSQTKYVMGLPTSDDNPLSGNPSPYTAQGVFTSVQSLVSAKGETLEGKVCGVSGLGAVGYDVARRLHESDAKLLMSDINQEVLDKALVEFENAEIVAPDEIISANQDIFVPCALGGILNDETIPSLHASLISGAANNQLEDGRAHGEMLHEKGIVYAPDYVVNAGGIIAVCYGYLYATQQNPYAHELNLETLSAHVERIGETVIKIYKRSQGEGRPTNKIADEMAEEIFNRGKVSNLMAV